MTIRITRKTFALVGVLAAVFVATTAYAAIPDGGGVIHGCYDKVSGVMRVSDTATNVPKTCTAKEAALNWNQQGPKGDPGAPGGSSDGYITHTDSAAFQPATTLSSMYLPAGSYVLSAKFLAASFTPNQTFTCSFGAGADLDKASGNTQAFVTNSYFGLSTAHTFAAGGWVTLACNAANIVVAQDITLTAVQVGTLHTV